MAGCTVESEVVVAIGCKDANKIEIDGEKHGSWNLALSEGTGSILPIHGRRIKSVSMAIWQSALEGWNCSGS